jgi:hypothetical protein
MVVQESAVRRLRDRAPMKALVLQVQWEARGAERLLDRLEVRSCWCCAKVGRIVVKVEFRRQDWVEVTRRRAGIAEVLRVDTVVVSWTEAVVEVSKGCVVHFVSMCVVDVKRTGKARVGKRGAGDLTGHLGSENG